MKYVLLTFLFLVVSCSSHKMSSKSDYASDVPEYLKRPVLSTSFLAKGPSNLSDQDIQKLLTSRIQVKDSVKIAIFKVDHSGTNYWHHGNSYSMQESVDETTQKEIDELLTKTNKIKDIIFIPSFLMPQEKSLSNLRDSAALVQADLLLIMKTQSRSNFDLNLLQPDEALAIASIESALMDVATGVIPYTSIVTGKVKAKMNKDFNREEFLIRSRKEAENEAMKSLMKDMQRFFK